LGVTGGGLLVVTHKTELEVIDGTPEKRSFLSLISDYNLKIGIFELVDNAIDFWTRGGATSKLHIDIRLDADRQILCVRDDAGGVQRKDTRLLISPGATGNPADIEVIGIFGVGGKRAAVALGERVEIKTRYKKEKSLQIDLTSDWLLESDEWTLPVYEIPDLIPGTTTVDVSKLRQSFSADDVELIRTSLGETYDWFIRNNCEIKLNGKAVKPISFSTWAYPPGFEPQEGTFELHPTATGTLKVHIEGGLILDRDPDLENYGVYVYCNNRLIVKELRTRDVGYLIASEAGVPHPDASLCRVIVRLQGLPELMPWNSSKSDVNASRPSFAQVRPIIIQLVKYFTKLSRRWKNDWDAEVFAHRTGTKHVIDPSQIETGKKITLPEIPRTRSPALTVDLKERNKKIIENAPWTLGIVEAMGILEVIGKQKLSTKNRIVLVLLDSNFEIALKEFIVSRTDLFPPQQYPDTKIATIFKARHLVINEVKAHVNLSQTLLQKVSYYYNLRNKLIHERATVGITDEQVTDYRRTVELVLKKLFKLQFPKAD
jgi:hypothetical protein